MDGSSLAMVCIAVIRLVRARQTVNDNTFIILGKIVLEKIDWSIRMRIHWIGSHRDEDDGEDNER